MRTLSCPARTVPPLEKSPFGDKGGGGGFFSVSHPDTIVTIVKSPPPPLFKRGGQCRPDGYGPGVIPQ
jgi:hypothetical protein